MCCSCLGPLHCSAAFTVKPTQSWPAQISGQRSDPPNIQGKRWPRLFQMALFTRLALCSRLRPSCAQGNRRCPGKWDGREPGAGGRHHRQPAAHGPGHGQRDRHAEPPDRQDHGEGTAFVLVVFSMLSNAFTTKQLPKREEIKKNF